MFSKRMIVIYLLTVIIFTFLSISVVRVDQRVTTTEIPNTSEGTKILVKVEDVDDRYYISLQPVVQLTCDNVCATYRGFPFEFYSQVPYSEEEAPFELMKFLLNIFLAFSIPLAILLLGRVTGLIHRIYTNKTE